MNACEPGPCCSAVTYVCMVNEKADHGLSLDVHLLHYLGMSSLICVLEA